MRILKISLFILISFLFGCKKDEFSKFDSKKTHNFGIAKIGDTIRYKFKLKNVSDNLLKINQIGTSCSCTGAIISDSIIKKNNFAVISITYIPTIENKGFIKNSIVVEANTNPTFTTLYLEGIVK